MEAIPGVSGRLRYSRGTSSVSPDGNLMVYSSMPSLPTFEEMIFTVVLRPSFLWIRFSPGYMTLSMNDASSGAEILSMDDWQFFSNTASMQQHAVSILLSTVAEHLHGQ